MKITNEEVTISDKTFVPNEQWMAKMYDEMNKMLFNGSLGACSFGIFTTGRGSGGGVLGWFKITGQRIRIERRYRRMYRDDYYNKEYVSKDNFVELCQPKIELNGNYRGTEHGFLSTLVHEMCHYYTYMHGWAPVQAHGREFRDIGYVVASRSNGMFTVQRIATAEQMSELELNDEMKAKKEKRLANKKAAAFALITFTKMGEIFLTISKDEKLIERIRTYYLDKGETSIKTNDANVIEFLFSKGYTKIMRTWRYWTITDKPWIDELKSLLIGGNDNDIESPYEDEFSDMEETSPKRTFLIKTTTGSFECEFSSEEELINKIKERFPKMSDETVSKVISNPANYVNENTRRLKDIISEVISEFIENENMKNMGNGGDIDINPDMNLGEYSPLEISESNRNVARIRITWLADMGRNKEMIMKNLLKLRKARNVGDEETVNNTVLSTLRRYPSYIQFEVIG